MAKGHLTNHKELDTTVRNAYLWTVSFTGVGSGAAVADPTYGGDGELAVAVAGAGVYTLTFRGDVKPYSLVAVVGAGVLGDVIKSVEVTSYTQSTGVLAVQTYSDKGVTADDLIGDTIYITCLFSKVEN